VKFYSLITLFPEAIEPYLQSSILKRAQETIKKKGSKAGRKAVIKVQMVDPKKFAQEGRKKKVEGSQNQNKSKPSARVDDKPYAGGPGMVLRAEPVLKAFEEAQKHFLKSYIRKLSSPTKISDRQKENIIKKNTSSSEK
jgi:tRNA (guanine-N1)-methyltransferase